MENPSSSSQIVIPTNNCNIFPSDVLKWMKINAKPLFSLKLMQVCKYFKHKKFPYLVLQGIANEEDGSWKYEEDEVLVAPSLDIFSERSLWITDYLHLYHRTDPFSSMLSKIAVCQANHFYCESQNITMDEFKILTACGTFQYVTFINTSITGEDGKEVAALENILECLPNITYISFDLIIPSIVSLKDAATLNLSKLKLLEMYRVSESFDFYMFTEFMKIHPLIQCRITYNDQFILSPEYKQQLEEYIKKLLKAGITDDHPPPVIHFPEQDPQFTIDVLHQQYEARLRERLGIYRCV